MHPLMARKGGPLLQRGAAFLRSPSTLWNFAAEGEHCCCAYYSSSSNSSSNRSGSSSNSSSATVGSEGDRCGQMSLIPATDVLETNSSSSSSGSNTSSSSNFGVYRRPEGYIDVVFKWGVGNSYRAQNANRYRPVHIARPKRVSLPASYFDSPCPAVSYESLNEAWEVAFFENNKRSSKPFPIKKWGIQKSKQEAIDFANRVKAEGRLEAPQHASQVPELHGFDKAKQLAEEAARLHRYQRQQVQQQQERQQQQQ